MRRGPRRAGIFTISLFVCMIVLSLAVCSNFVAPRAADAAPPIVSSATPGGLPHIYPGSYQRFSFKQPKSEKLLIGANEGINWASTVPAVCEGGSVSESAVAEDDPEFTYTETSSLPSPEANGQGAEGVYYGGVAGCWASFYPPASTSCTYEGTATSCASLVCVLAGVPGTCFAAVEETSSPPQCQDPTDYLVIDPESQAVVCLPTASIPITGACDDGTIPGSGGYDGAVPMCGDGDETYLSGSSTAEVAGTETASVLRFDGKIARATRASIIDMRGYVKDTSASAQAKPVLRYRYNNPIVLSHGKGDDWTAIITASAAQRVLADSISGHFVIRACDASGCVSAIIDFTAG